MYKILLDGNYIFDDATNLEEYKLIKPKLTLAVNQAGSLSFKLPPSNRGYDEEGILNKQVLVLKNGDALLYGRVMTESVDIWGNRDIYCEGELSFLNDTHQPQGKWQNMTIEAFLTQLINVHNSHVAANKQFRVGNVTVTDPDIGGEDTIYRFTNWETTWDCIQDKLLDKFGGYLQVRYVNNVRYLDYLAAIPTVGGQNITFGKNLLDFTRNFDANDIKTVIVPFGAALDEEAVEGLTAYLDVKSVNGGSPYVYNQSAVNEFGWVEEVVHWDDVTQPANLLRNAQNYLEDVQYEKMIIDLNAFDLNRIDPDIPSLECGELVYVQSDVHNLHRNFLVSKVVLQLDDPGQDEYVLGAESKTVLFSDSVQTEIQKNYKRTEQKGNDISNLKQAAITDVDVYYAQGNSASEAPTSGWSPVAPQWEDGKYMWQYTHTRKANGTDDDSDPTNITGAKGNKGDRGDSGVSVTSSTEQYYLSTSSSEPTGGSWSNSVPAYISGRYYWTRTHTTFSDGTTSDSTPAIDLGLTDANQRAALADSKADNISRGLITNYYTKTDVDQGMQELEGEILSTVSNSYVDQSTYATDIDNLQQQIDGAVETFTGSAVPTLNNYPASDWNTDTKKDKHIGDLYLVNSSGGSQAGFYYRFEKNNNVYSWVHVPDSDVQKALADAAAANAAAIAAQGTADGIAEDLQQNYYTATQTDSAIDQKADDILLQVGSTYATQQTVTNVKNSTIKSDVLHYLATSAGSGVTRSTPGWTTTIQSMTETNQYLWTYHTYTYGDDHTSDTDPIITGRYGQNGSQGPQGATGPQGPQGEKGDTGDTGAQGPQGVKGDKGDTGNTGAQGPQGNPGANGISIVEVVPLYYASNSTTAPAAPTSNVTRTDTATRVWTRGIPALTSTDKYMYTCDQVKYSNNNYTWTSVVLDNSLTNLTERMTQAELDLQPDSITAKVSSTNTFTTLQQFNNLQIGGRNLLRRTDYSLYNYANGDYNVTVPRRISFANDRITIGYGNEAYTRGYAKNKINGTLPAGTKITCSVYVYEQSIPDGNHRIYCSPITSADGTPSWTNVKVINKDFTGMLTWQYTIPDNYATVYGFVVDFDTRSSTSGQMVLGQVKIEIGDKATDWSPAPEDLDEKAQEYANTAETTAKSYTDSQIQVSASGILSTVEQGYTTKTEFSNLSIGGENLLRDTSGAKSQVITYSSGQTYGVYDYYELIDTTNNLFKEDDEIVISFDWAVNVTSGKFRVEAATGNPYNWGTLQKAEGTDGATSNTVTISSSNQSGHVVLYYKISAAVVQSTTLKYFRIRLDNVNATVTISNAKLERGNIATAWSPSPYDMAVGTNLLRYAPKSKTPTGYQALQLNLTEKLVKGQTYTLQLWDIDISHTGKQASELNVSVFAGGGKNLLATLTGFTNGHADYKVVTFTVSVNPNQPTHLDNLWLNIYNSVPNASGTLNLTIGSWKLEKGNKATEWQMNPIDASSKSEVQQLANMVAVKVNSSGRLVTAALGVDPASSTSYFKVKADDIDIISNGNIQLTSKSIGISSTNFSVTAAGVVTCSNITATGGKIGDWDIVSDGLSKTSGTYTATLYPFQIQISNGNSLATLSSHSLNVDNIETLQFHCGYIITEQPFKTKFNIDSNGNVDAAGTGLFSGILTASAGLKTNTISSNSGSTVTINNAMTVNSNGKVSVTNDIKAGGELIAGYGMELGMASANAAALIDFHWASNNTDFTARIWQRGENTVDLIGKNSSTWGIWRAGSFSSQSSIHAKENIKDISDDEAKKILELRPVSFDYKNGGTKDQRGLIAEEVLDILPNMVIGADIEYNEDEPWNTPSIDYSRFVPYLIKMIQVQQREIDILKSK